MMEEVREERVAKVLSWMQSTARGNLSRIQYNKFKVQKVTFRSMRKFLRRFRSGLTRAGASAQKKALF